MHVVEFESILRDDASVFLLWQTSPVTMAVRLGSVDRIDYHPFWPQYFMPVRY